MGTIRAAARKRNVVHFQVTAQQTTCGLTFNGKRFETTANVTLVNCNNCLRVRLGRIARSGPGGLNKAGKQAIGYRAKKRAIAELIKLRSLDFDKLVSIHKRELLHKASKGGHADAWKPTDHQKRLLESKARHAALSDLIKLHESDYSKLYKIYKRGLESTRAL